MRLRLVLISVVALAAVMRMAFVVSASEVCFQDAIGNAAGYSPASSSSADLDGDGDQDLAVANDVYGTGTVSVLMNNGDGTFASPVSYAAGSGPVSILTADLDGDGDFDIATANTSGNNVAVLKNNGSGSFGAAVMHAVGLKPGSIVAADVDGDLDLDLATANSNGYAGVSILRNNGDGTFADAVGYPAGGGPESLCAADLDGDGDQDLAVADYHGNGSGGGVSILMNEGDGSFMTVENYDVGPYPASIIAIDLDADRAPDLAVACADNDSISVLFNNGGGAYAPAINYAAGNAPSAVFGADLDLDGDQDLVVTDYWDACISVLSNSGDGTLSATVSYVTGPRPTSVIAANLNEDGYPDLAASCSRYDGRLWVLISCILPPPMQVDVGPGACPNVISVGSIDIPHSRPEPASIGRPVVAVAVLGTKKFDVMRVDPTTVTIAAITPVAHTYADISRPVDLRESECECNQLGADGYADLVLQFPRDALLAALSPYTDDEVMTLTLEGLTKTGMPISGTDCATITSQPIRIGLSTGDNQVRLSAWMDCRPNPFNASTVISFSNSASDRVQLEVYNVLGQRVATLVDAELPAGPHEVVWDASGSASGVYFAHLIASGGGQTKQMVVMK